MIGGFIAMVLGSAAVGTKAAAESLSAQNFNRRLNNKIEERDRILKDFQEKYVDRSLQEEIYWEIHNIDTQEKCKLIIDFIAPNVIKCPLDVLDKYLDVANHEIFYNPESVLCCFDSQRIEDMCVSIKLSEFGKVQWYQAEGLHGLYDCNIWKGVGYGKEQFVKWIINHSFVLSLDETLRSNGLPPMIIYPLSAHKECVASGDFEPIRNRYVKDEPFYPINSQYFWWATKPSYPNKIFW